MELSNLNNGDPPLDAHRFSEDMDSTCSTPYVSAPSSPGRSPSGYFFSAPASPMHYVLASSKAHTSSSMFSDENVTRTEESFNSSGSFEFEFSSRFLPTSSTEIIGSMSSADELFLNGQIRPMKLSSHLQRPQFLDPLLDLEDEDDCLGNREIKVARGRDMRMGTRSLHRKARSLSPLRGGEYFREPRQVSVLEEDNQLTEKVNETNVDTDEPSIETTPSVSASSSRSSSSGRNSKKWIFLKDFLHRSKSEGRGNSKEKFWSSMSFSHSARERKLSSPSLTPSSSRDEKVRNPKANKQLPAKKSGGTRGKPANGVSKRRVPLSAHELHYTKNRAQAEEMKKKTFLPYRQGLFGCLGFSSKGYGALSGFTKSLNPVTTR